MPAIGNAIGIPFKRGAFDWDAYLLTIIPLDLVLTVISDTEIDGTFTINGEDQDGHEVYISTDGITYILDQTLVGVDNTFQTTGLIPGTLYYLRVRAYRGIHYSGYSNTDFVTTQFNSALINGWNFTEESNNAFSNALGDLPFTPINSFAGQYYNGKTYIAFSGLDDDPYIIVFTHSTGLFSAAVKIGINPLANDDDHGQPAIIVDDLGYIHCVWGAHNSELQYSKSTNSEDITAWTAMTSPIPDPEDCTYPQLFQTSDNKIWLFYRSVGGVTSNWGYKTSIDRGVNWSAYVEISEDIAYWYFKKGIGDTFHAVGFGNNQTSATRKNVYYIFFNGTNWINIDGDIQPTPIVLAGNNVLAYDSDDYYTPSAIIAFDSTNKPIIIFQLSVAELDLTLFDQKILKHNGIAWESFNIGNRTGFLQSYVMELDIIDIDTYHAYLVNHIAESIPHSGQMIKWLSNDAGETWGRDQLIKSGNIYGHTMIRNYHTDAKIVFSTYKGVLTAYDNSGYLWGESGFKGSVNSVVVPSIKGSTVGTKNTGLLLAEGGGYDFKGNPDGIRVQDADVFSFDTGSPDAPFTITVKIHASNTVNAQNFFIKSDSSGLREYQCSIGTNKIDFLCITPTVANYIYASAPYISNDEVFVCFTYDGSGLETGMKIYLDLIESQTAQTETGTYTGMTNTTAGLWIGNYRGTGNFLVGQMKELKIWNKILSPTEMGYVKNNVAGW